jgi:hypothetical protein
MGVFASKCIAEFGTAAVFALRSGHAPKSELDERLCGEYSLAFVEGEFDFTVAEMVSGVFPSCAWASPNIQLVRNALCTTLAASDMLDMCVVEIEAHFTRLVVCAVIEAMQQDRKRARVYPRRPPGTHRQSRNRRPSSRSLELCAPTRDCRIRAQCLGRAIARVLL